MVIENFDRPLRLQMANRSELDDVDHNLLNTDEDDRDQNCSCLKNNMFMNKLKSRQF